MPQRRFRQRDWCVEQQRERARDGRLTDREIRVTRTLPCLVSGNAHARGQPQAHETEQHRELVVAQRADTLVAARHVGDGRERVARVQRRVRGRDGEPVDRVRVHHVAEVDDAGDALVSLVQVAIGANDHVEVVRIIMDHAFRQATQARPHVALEGAEEAADHLAQRSLTHDREMLP